MEDGSGVDSEGINQRDSELTPQRYQEIKRVFAEACRLDAEQRSAYLDQVCAGDKQLRHEVETLLEHDDSSLPLGPDVSAAAALGMADGAGSSMMAGFADSSERLPKQIGRFRIVSKIGQGGMGVVYQAEQENPSRTIALKVIRPGVASDQILRRFQFEGHVLGRLQHPGIAQIYEAGTARVEIPGTVSIEQPFFAMEYIRGKSLSELVESKNLGTRQRLELFAKICDAVQHAHQKGVIHRDLKPGNIMVDEAGQPKILDFGVARITDADVQVTTLQTDVGQLIGTIPYMSPEQVAGDSSQLDTRADVYSLGVVCYQMLTGRYPHDLQGKTIPEAARAISEDDPIRLSTINRIFRGDLDTIVSKALEKEKERRYQSASDFAADIRRYLADQPISARPATTLYQLRKFTSRNKALVAGVLVALLALIVGIIGTTSQAVRATNERNNAQHAEQVAEQRRQEAETQREEAQRQAAIAEAVNDFLNSDLLAAASPLERGRDVTIREVLDRASEAIAEKFTDQPLVEAEIRMTLGETYMNLGLIPQAEQHFVPAFEIRQRLLGLEHPDTLESMLSVGYMHVHQARYDQAEPLFLELLEHQRRALDQDDPQVLSTLGVLGVLYKRLGRYDEAEPLYLEVLEARRRTLGDQHRHTITSMNNLAVLYRRQERYDEAEKLYLEALENSRQAFGNDHPDTLRILNGLAIVYKYQQRYQEALPLYLETVEAERRVLGDDHPDTLQSVSTLAVLYRAMDLPEKAEPLFLDTLERQRRLMGNDHPMTLTTIGNLGSTYSAWGRHEQADELLVENYESHRRVYGDEHDETLNAIGLLVKLRNREERYEEAEPLARRLYELRCERLGQANVHTIDTMHELARAVSGMRQFEEAEQLTLECYRLHVDAYGENHPRTRLVADTLIELYERWIRRCWLNSGALNYRLPMNPIRTRIWNNRCGYCSTGDLAE